MSATSPETGIASSAPSCGPTWTRTLPPARASCANCATTGRAYSHFVTEEERQQYLTHVARHGTWGDELRLRAFADAYNTTVHVHDARVHTRVLARYDPDGGGNGGDVHKHVVYNGMHYDALA